MESQKVCVVCGKNYIAQRSNSKTCSNTCRVHLYQQNKVDKKVEHEVKNIYDEVSGNLGKIYDNIYGDRGTERDKEKYIIDTTEKLRLLKIRLKAKAAMLNIDSHD